MAPAILPNNFDHQNRGERPECQRLFLLFFAAWALGRQNAACFSFPASLNSLDNGKAGSNMGLSVPATIFRIISMSKIKIAIICAVALAALATDMLQFQRIKALRQENDILKQQAAQVAPLQEQAARAAQDAAQAGGDASLREAQVRDLARLRNEVARLREQTNQLAKARQEIQTLNQQIASEAEARTRSGEALQAAQAEAQKTRNVNACINNLRLIDASKQQWALENRKQSTDTPTMEDLRPYLGRGPNGELPVCPDGGVYAMGAVGEKPTCSIPGHVLP
jgi:hypothetical protein